LYKKTQIQAKLRP